MSNMADAFVSTILAQWTLFIQQEIQEEVKLVVGVEKEVEKLTDNFQAIQAVLADAEERQVKDKSVRFWLDKLKDASYDMEDVLDEWTTARMKFQIEGVDHKNALLPQKKVCYFLPASCFGFKQIFLRRDIACKIKDINENLDYVFKQKDKFNFNLNVIKSSEKPERIKSTSLIDESEICGRDQEKNTLMSKLLCASSEEQKGLQIISIVGMGGIGKTTLAQHAYNNHEVKCNFKRIWVCVSHPFDEFRIAKAIIEGLEGCSSKLSEFQSLLEHIHESIGGKKFFLVLDDLWNEDYTKWEPFNRCLKNGLHGSRILITTRKERVARIMKSTDIIPVKELVEEECWLLFRRIAFSGRSNDECEKLEEIGRKVAGKCKGLPLAAKTLGSLLSFKKTNEEWQRISDSEMWNFQEVKKGLLAPLLLSYNDLPSVVKRCFSYCAVFPKGYEIRKDELINLWLAQGFLSVEQNKDTEERIDREYLEVLGQEYFEILVTYSFFQVSEKSGDNDIFSCKMHDIVHDFAQFVSNHECFTMEVNDAVENINNSSFEKIRHSMLIFGKRASFPVSICNFKKLRSLLIYGGDYSSINEVLPKLFIELTCLRVLSFNKRLFWENGIKEIPEEVRKLIHLRYLNLSDHEMKNLPDSLCELYNLQILNIDFCRKLEELPQGMGKLKNLRQLKNYQTDSLSYMPKGMETLTSLRTLHEFVVSGGIDGGKACSLESLNNFNLTGYLIIRKLGNVLSDVGEAKKLKLQKMKKLDYLGLKFNKDEEEGRTNEENEVLLLEALQPPPNLKRFEIHQYRGNAISPSWLMLLTKVSTLRLIRCINCEQLPPLGKLPSLGFLSLMFMGRVKRVGNEFLGVERDPGSSSSSSVIAFPRLKTLEIRSMEELEEWDYGTTRQGKNHITIMPCLSSFRIYGCRKLKALPDHIFQTITLHTFEIWTSPIIRRRYRKEIGEDWLKISHIPEILIP